MASYHFSAKVIGRTSGRSSTAAAAYRSGEMIQDARTGLTHDYTRKHGVSDSFIMAPNDAPEWVQDREALWNAVEAIENRKNSQLARDITMALPDELTPEERKAILVAFVQEQFVDRGMIADVNIHAPHHKGDQRNHHAHVMLTMREITEEGWSKNKNRDWNDTELLETWREKWADFQNRALENGKHLDRVDHRSYERQGKNREATQHMGPQATEIYRRDGESDIVLKNKEIKRRNNERDRLEKMGEVMELQVNDRIGGKMLRDPDELRAKLQDRHLSDRATLAKRHELQNSDLDAKIEEAYGDFMREMQDKKTALTSRLEADGLKGVLRTVSGMNFMDRKRLEGVDKSLADASQRIDEMRSGLSNAQKLDHYHMEVSERQSWRNLEGFIDSGQSYDYYRTRRSEFDKANEYELERGGREMSMEMTPSPSPKPTMH